MTEDQKKQSTQFTLMLLSANPSDEEIAAVVEMVKHHSTNPDRVGANERKTKKTKARRSHMPKSPTCWQKSTE